jgi:hypothetical protein
LKEEGMLETDETTKKRGKNQKRSQEGNCELFFIYSFILKIDHLEKGNVPQGPDLELQKHIFKNFDSANI